MKIKISNYLLLAVLPCSIQEHKFERKTFKLLIGGILQAMLAVCRGISLKVKLSNNLLVAVLQAMLAVCRDIKMIYDMFFTVKTDRKYKV